MSKLHLIPVELSDAGTEVWLPEAVRQQASRLKVYIAENAKTARAFLKKTGTDVPLQEITIHTLSAKTPDSSISEWLSEVDKDTDIGLVSEAGCPAVADPGARVVAVAHQRGWQVVPHTGPNSIVLGLMASGLDGQRFAFHGYLAIKPDQRGNELKHLENISRKQSQTQIFIETPYRNEAMLQSLCDNLKPSTKLCVARDLTGPQEWVCTKTIAEWKKKKPEIGKVPCLFLFLA